jgi:hypothetical protein
MAMPQDLWHRTPQVILATRRPVQLLGPKRAGATEGFRFCCPVSINPSHDQVADLRWLERRKT